MTLQESLSHLQSLALLPNNWDSYGALPISAEAIKHARDIISTIADEYPTPACPIPVPAVCGGIQLEWHQRGVDLEIAISAQGNLISFSWERPDDSDTQGAHHEVAALWAMISDLHARSLPPQQHQPS